MCVRRKRIVVGGVIECGRTRRCGIEIGGVAMRVRGFGELEAVVMDRIWDREATTTVREIFDELAAEREIAYTTVMSTMDNLHTKGWLARERDGKAYRYWPTLTREQHSAQLMREALDGGGRSELVLSHFLEQISPEESARLRDALQRLARRARRK
jgi:predicted transcriptional regulator